MAAISGTSASTAGRIRGETELFRLSPDSLAVTISECQRPLTGSGRVNAGTNEELVSRQIGFEKRHEIAPGRAIDLGIPLRS